MFARARPPNSLFRQISVADAAYVKKAKLQNEAETAQTLEKKRQAQTHIKWKLVKKKAFKIIKNAQNTGRKSLTKMAIQLDKILADIAKEKVLHPNNAGATKQEQDEAWARIGRLNKLTVHESRSIFIVLQKKYEQEKLKGNSGWKLFGLMQKIHQEPKAVVKTEE